MTAIPSIAPSPTSTTAQAPGARLASLDQFRGYTVAGMLLVNFLGGFRAIPAVLKHHNTYCSYADTIMPQFFFAVGFAFRLTFERRLRRDGARAAYGRAISRCLGLILLGLVIYHLDGGAKTWADLRGLGVIGVLGTAFQRSPFQALVHIGLTSLWVLPVIAAGPVAQIAYLVASAAAHLALSHSFYYDWVMHRPGIDGGPLGFLTWTIPLLVGSLACDAMTARPDGRPVGRLLSWSAALMLIGYGLACLTAVGSDTSAATPQSWLVEPPFVPPTRPADLWTMSQRAGSISYLAFASGFSLLVYTLFVLACDVGRARVGLFRTFGQNALAAYVLHSMVAAAVKPYVPKDAPLWYVLAGLAVYFGITYLFVRHLEKDGIFLRM